MLNLFCSFSHRRARYNRGFTLIELLVVVGIMGLSAALMAPVLADRNNATLMDMTLTTMGEIEEAVLGRHCERVRGDLVLGGYVGDMGGLPDLVDRNGLVVASGGQPRGLWTRDIKGTPGNTLDDLPEPKGYTPGHFYFVLGWRGPYLGMPAGGVLKDGWNTPLVFETDAESGDMTITSLGSDGKPGGAGHAADIVRTIRSGDYRAPVAGYIPPYIVYHGTVLEDGKTDIELGRADPYERGEPDAPDGPIDPDDVVEDDYSANLRRQFPLGAPEGEVKVRIYYRPRGGGSPDDEILLSTSEYLDFYEVDVEADGYFAFTGDRRIPLGTERVLVVWQPIREDTSGEGNWKDSRIVLAYKIHVGRGINWLENMGNIP
jgi:prepilin-type N-terminal cleavage/methylation domain-containing protein